MWYIQSVPFYSSTYIVDGSNSLSTNCYSYCSLFHWYLQKHGGIRSTPSWQLITQRFLPIYIWLFSKPADVHLVTLVRNDFAIMADTLQRTMIITAGKLLKYDLLLRRSFDRGLLSNLL